MRFHMSRNLTLWLETLYTNGMIEKLYQIQKGQN